MEAMKSKKKIEQFLIILELQEMTMPIFQPFKRKFVRSMIQFVRKYISEVEGELIDLDELQGKIDSIAFPWILKGKLTRWQVDWVTGVMNYFYYWS